MIIYGNSDSGRDLGFRQKTWKRRYRATHVPARLKIPRHMFAEGEENAARVLFVAVQTSACSKRFDLISFPAAKISRLIHLDFAGLFAIE